MNPSPTLLRASRPRGSVPSRLRTPIHAAVAAALAVCAAPAVMAQSDSQLQRLQDQVRELQRQIDELRAQQHAGTAAPAQSTAAPEPAKQAAAPVTAAKPPGFSVGPLTLTFQTAHSSTFSRRFTPPARRGIPYEIADFRFRNLPSGRCVGYCLAAQRRFAKVLSGLPE